MIIWSLDFLIRMNTVNGWVIKGVSLMNVSLLGLCRLYLHVHVILRYSRLLMLMLDYNWIIVVISANI